MSGTQCSLVEPELACDFVSGSHLLPPPRDRGYTRHADSPSRNTNQCWPFSVGCHRACSPTAVAPKQGSCKAGRAPLKLDPPVAMLFKSQPRFNCVTSPSFTPQRFRIVTLSGQRRTAAIHGCDTGNNRPTTLLLQGDECLPAFAALFGRPLSPDAGRNLATFSSGPEKNRAQYGELTGEDRSAVVNHGGRLPD